MYDTIVEPFAGGAGYSLNYWTKQVILVELDEATAAAWDFLIQASEKDVLRLPLLDVGQPIDDLDVCYGARELIRLWCRRGYHKVSNVNRMPALSNKSQRKLWSASTRARVAQTAARIGHWKVVHGSYQDAPDIKATWFIDPPYTKARTLGAYRCGPENVDFDHLSEWTMARRGQVIATDYPDAKWLPWNNNVVTIGGTRKNGDAYLVHRNVEAYYHAIHD